jgi:hypothetical protein
MEYNVGDTVRLNNEQGIVVAARRLLSLCYGRTEYYEFVGPEPIAQRYGFTLREMKANRATLLHAAPQRKR